MIMKERFYIFMRTLQIVTVRWSFGNSPKMPESRKTKKVMIIFSIYTINRNPKYSIELLLYNRRSIKPGT